ncbi:uncharacterized protein LOC119766321 [Culex quinquefasciatus]|uniref:uncharacterized protein LOC119766321 n=1 Tax=Culex quinquefasciatus TaxID=7176 RepID=UPI0018E2EC45|nr:uncharacterized protein LOC119766321 [Culex quinquefasciatus]
MNLQSYSTRRLPHATTPNMTASSPCPRSTTNLRMWVKRLKEETSSSGLATAAGSVQPPNLLNGMCALHLDQTYSIRIFKVNLNLRCTNLPRKCPMIDHSDRR